MQVNFQGVWSPLVRTRKLYRGGFLKSREDSKKLLISVEFFDWLVNKNQPWTAYHEFISDYLVVLYKHPSVCFVGVRKTLIHLFAKCVLKVIGRKVTNECQYNQLWEGSKAGIGGSIHKVKAI